VPDQLTLVRNQKGKIDVIGTLSMDSYLSGVVGAEMPASWPMEALKAQSVAARSFAIYMVRHNKSKDYDVAASVYDQAFNFEPIPSQSEGAQRVRKALSETSRDVLFDGNRRIIKAYYSADCGCQSEDPKYVWGRSESMESVKDPTCRQRSPYEWNWNVERSDLRSKLLATLGLPVNSELKALHVASRTPSGRVHAVALLWSVNGENQNVEMNAQDFRRVIGFNRVRSTDFNLTWWGDILQISGEGLGHGVGLCQRGARSLSEQGLSYKDILKFYYPKATIGTGPRT
jgi:stage II sporulation protein D